MALRGPISHWLAKIHHQECFVDLIFNSSNGLCPVDEEWFSRSVPPRNILDTPVKIIPLEELIWQKAYIMERERFDGADIAHNLVLFGFIYPSRRGSIPRQVMDELLRRVD